MTTHTKMLSIAMAALMALYLVPVPAQAEEASSVESADAIVQVAAPDGSTTSYASLKEAIDAAPSGSTLSMYSDVSVPATNIDGINMSLKIDKSLTLNGNGHTLTVAGRGIYLYGGNDYAHMADIAIKNMTIVNPDNGQRAVSARDGYKRLSFADVNMQTTRSGNTQVFTVGGNTPQNTEISFAGCTLTASEAGYGIVTFNPVNLTISDTQISGFAAIYMKGQDSSAGSSGSTVIINDGSILTSKGIPGDSNRFGTIVFEDCDDVTVDVKNSTISAAANDTDPATPQGAILYSQYQNGIDHMAQNDTVILGEGSRVSTTGKYGVLAMGNGQPSTIKAEGGSYSIQGPLFDPADDPQGTELYITGGKWNKDVSPYVSEDYVSAPDTESGYVVQPKSQSQDDPTKPAVPSTNPGGSGQPATHDPSNVDKEPAQKAEHSNGSNGERAIKRPVAVSAQSGAATNPTKASNPTQTTTNAKQGSQLQETGDSSFDYLIIAAGAVSASAIAIGLLLLLRKRSATRRS